jgi:DNA-binding response OmpR family regulator
MPVFLVIDDDMSLAIGVRALLRKEGIDVVVASSDRLDLEAIETADVDVIIVDTSMAGVDPRSTIGAVRRNARSVPIIATSGRAVRESLDPIAMATNTHAFGADTQHGGKGLLTVTKLVSTE